MRGVGAGVGSCGVVGRADKDVPLDTPWFVPVGDCVRAAGGVRPEDLGAGGGYGLRGEGDAGEEGGLNE